MDKEAAAKILAKEIGDKLGRETVYEEVQKDYLIRNCSAFCQVGKPILVNKVEHYYNGWENPLNFAAHMCKKVCLSNRDAKYFNYIFFTHAGNTTHKSSAYLNYTATAYALIGEKEKKSITNLFYKDIPEDIALAMDIFHILDYTSDYNDYINNTLTNFTPDFRNFVFHLPYEDQNIEQNKKFLKKEISHIEYIDILAEEYAKGRHFTEYFNCLDNFAQKNIVKCLSGRTDKNLALDSFLWSKGFKEIKLGYMDMYQNNADGFIDYFKDLNPDEKKIALKGIMNCDYTNQAVADWLDENEVELMRKVGFDG